ncbi:MAG: sugar phosphate isomerase/epimerase [Chloroflexi bacterium]|nr:sugar phosphate isomerase/epimerase [Chloroflexota bacterium]
MDQVLLSANRANFDQCLKLALQYNLGMELMAFAFPQVLDSEWRELLAEYQEWLRPVRGPITMHGPFLDMAPGSPDKRINEICKARFKHGIHIASQLGAQKIIFHANFIAAIHNTEYRVGWHQRNLGFWREMADYAAEHQIVIAIENMWEFDPYIIGDLLAEIDHPHLRACIDIGHAHLFSIQQDPDLTFEDWIRMLEPFLVHLHMNNNDGKLDVHRGLPDGVLNYTELLRRIRQLRQQPTMTLEMDHVEDMRISLSYFNLSTPTGHLRQRMFAGYNDTLNGDDAGGRR